MKVLLICVMILEDSLIEIVEFGYIQTNNWDDKLYVYLY